jgi:hypothetical protein
MATDIHQIDLNDYQRQLLATAADHMGVPWTEVFEKAIAPLAADRDTATGSGKAESAYEVLLREGLIGCIEGTPSDLSTNKQHMRGYGTDD